MNRFDGFLRWAWSILVVCSLAFALGACSGDDGKDGAAGAAGAAGADGADGPAGPVGPEGPPGTGSDAVAAAKIESCATCHSGVGDGHQAEYNKYTDGTADAGTNLVMTFGAFRVTGVGPYDVELDFTVTQNGAPLANFGDLGLNRFYVTRWDPALEQYLEGTRIRTVTGANGAFTVADPVPFDPTTNASFYGYIGDEQVIIDDVNYDAHMGLYDNLTSAGMETPGAGVYASAAVVAGCEKCHGTPYMKHGNRAPAVAGLPDFASCKSCHYDDRTGGHEDWQYMVDEPLNWATAVTATADYSYVANVMNDTHMSHAMEFPYPMSMANCNTCHEGKLDQVLADAEFTPDTCKSCHAVQGIDAWPKTFDEAGDEILSSRGNSVPEKYGQPHRAPPIEYLWTVAEVEGFHSMALDCRDCHKAGGVGSVFTAYHTGYDVRISDASGQRYADLYTASIDQVTLSGNLLTINFSSSDVAMLPEVSVSFYGWDSKQFIVASHTRDGSTACGTSGSGCRMEFAPGDTNALFTEDAASVPGDWMVTLDMAAYVPTEVLTDDIPTMIANGDIKMAEITVTPELTLGGVEVGLDGVTQSFNLGTSVMVNDYFKGANATVDVEKCNDCHDQLAVTFHGGGRGGDIVICKNCHVTTSPGSHLEMASRAIDSYVHAIHSFQPFDLGSVDTTDPVEVKRTAMHEEHTFPNFTITNCEGCHVAGTFNVPDQAKSMPGVLSASDDIPLRNIGNLPEAVTGPASRACGGCHRVEFINEDLAGDLASFNAHTEAFGTFEENDAEDLVLYGVIDKIMSMFE